MRGIYPLLFILSAGVSLQAQTPEQKRATIAYIQKLQQTDGGFLAAAGTKQTSLRATSAAVRALKYFGGEVADADAARKFVARCYDANAGAFKDTPEGKPEVFITAVGLMAVTELKMPKEPYASKGVAYLVKYAKGFEEQRIAIAGFEAVGAKPAEMQSWLEEAMKARSANGTWGKGDGQARQTGSVAAMILRVGGKLENPEAVVRSLQDGQRPDGAFGKEGRRESDLETSYRVMRAMCLLGKGPARVTDLAAYVARCRDSDGGYGVEPGKPSTVGSTYYAAMILHWIDQLAK